MTDQDVDHLLDSYGTDFTPDVEDGLRRLRQRTGQTGSVRRIRPYYWAAAAAVLLLVGFLGFWQLRDQDTLLANASAAPLEVSLPDGTLVVLQSGAELRYGTDFNADARNVRLTGQAYFDVVSNPAVPFYVHGDHDARLRVTGTTFNLRADDREFEVEVSEGQVKLMSQVGERMVNVYQSGKIMADDASIITDEAPNLNCHAWRTGELNFRDTPLDEVLSCISNTFRVEVSHLGGADCDFPVSGKFRSKDPGEILTSVAKLGGGRLRSLGAGGSRYELSGLCSN